VKEYRDVVDFKKLRAAKAKPKPINPREIFNALPKPPGINDLYASQAEVMDNWFARRTDKDVVVKLHTGGGKTLVALLMAQSVMNEIGEPALSLAPTNQLVGQVLAKSREYGISALPYTKGQSARRILRRQERSRRRLRDAFQRPQQIRCSRLRPTRREGWRDHPR
jgi:replicative superfamily II helicase